MRHCIITPDTVGPHKNGGIGTHCYFLASHLAAQGHDVSLLLTIPVLEKDKAYWNAHYGERGVKLLYLQDYPFISCPVHQVQDLIISLHVWSFLQNEHFDQLYFQDWRAHGFHTIQAKRVQGKLQNTVVILTAHSSTQWINEGMAQWNAQHANGSKLIWAEHYCVAHCDILLSPSHYMLDWLKKAGWALPRLTRVIPNPIAKQNFDPPYEADIYSLAFFGRLETRKGLELFCSALNMLPQNYKERLKNIYFVGVLGTCNSIPADVYIKSRLKDFKHCVSLHTTLSTFAAQDFLQCTRSLICLPSLMDNHPYTALECVAKSMPVLAARTGGIPEILPDEQLFAPNPKALAAKLVSIFQRGHFQASVPRYDFDKTNAMWNVFCRECAYPQSIDSHVSPRVSVCMAHYNHGKYLPRALASLASQSYENFEVILTDDGSTDENSHAVFSQCEKKADTRFRFFSKTNEGPCLTRNFCASRATGEYLVFFDADNEAFDSMISTMVEAMQWSKVDALVCHFFAFSQDDTVPQNILNYNMPLGADLATGMLENVYGDVNFIVRRDVFMKLGGFAATRYGCEDWEFLARLSLQGYTMDVIPEPLFWYRYTTNGMRSTMSLYHSHQLVFSTYKKHLPSFAIDAFEQLLIPMFCGHSVSNAVIIRTMLRLGIRLEKWYIKHFPAGGKAQRFLSWLWHSCDRLFTKKG